MGLCCSRSSTTRVFKISKIAKRTVESEPRLFLNTQEIQVKKIKYKNPKNQNYFYVIQRNAWTIILDYLPYKDLCQAGREILIKFYKNNKICIINSPMVNINIYNNLNSVNPNKNKLRIPSLNSFPTFTNEEGNEYDNSSCRRMNSNVSSHKIKNSSIVSKSKNKLEKCESEVEKENILDNTPSFSQECSLSYIDHENSFHLTN